MRNKVRLRHRFGWYTGRTSKTAGPVNSRRALVELLEARQFLAASSPLVVPGAFTHPSSPQLLLTIGNTTYFSADDGVHGNELWKTDGTVTGTSLVKDINPGPADSFPFNLTNVNGTLFFTADDGTHGTELWKSDGTTAGTVMVKDIATVKVTEPLYVPSYGSRPEQLTLVNGTLFFSANDGVHGRELWESDGTADGTVMVQDIALGTQYVTGMS